MRKVVVDVETQKLRVLEADFVVAEFPVSTSRFGLGFEEGSFQTPTGHFVIHEKIGDGAPAWTIFRARQNTGETAVPEGEADHVLTRILTLEGLDFQNRNTRDRYIYIHGTNQENLIGTPASHGCVRLRNADMMALFDKVAAGMAVEILKPKGSNPSWGVMNS